MLPPPPRSTLFPYTRSSDLPAGASEQPASRRCFEARRRRARMRSEEHTSELQSLRHLVCRLLLEKKRKNSDQPLQKELQEQAAREVATDNSVSEETHTVLHR